MKTFIIGLCSIFALLALVVICFRTYHYLKFRNWKRNESLLAKRRKVIERELRDVVTSYLNYCMQKVDSATDNPVKAVGNQHAVITKYDNLLSEMNRLLASEELSKKVYKTELARLQKAQTSTLQTLKQIGGK